MKKETLLALAAFITALANNECAGSTETTTAEMTGPEPEKKRRGRPPGTATPPAEPVTGEQTQAPAEPAKPADKPKLTEEQVEENYQKLRSIIEPYVKGTWVGDGQPKQPKGQDVKKVLNSYKPEGWEGSGDYTTKELANFPEKHADFQRDIEALGY